MKPQTAKTYAANLQRFRDFIGPEGQPSTEAVVAFIRHLAEKNKPQSVVTIVQPLRKHFADSIDKAAIKKAIGEIFNRRGENSLKKISWFAAEMSAANVEILRKQAADDKASGLLLRFVIETKRAARARNAEALAAEQGHTQTQQP